MSALNRSAFTCSHVHWVVWMHAHLVVLPFFAAVVVVALHPIFVRHHVHSHWSFCFGIQLHCPPSKVSWFQTGPKTYLENNKNEEHETYFNQYLVVVHTQFDNEINPVAKSNQCDEIACTRCAYRCVIFIYFLLPAVRRCRCIESVLWKPQTMFVCLFM